MAPSKPPSVEEIVSRAQTLPPDERLDFLNRFCDLQSAEYAQAIELLSSRSPDGWWDHGFHESSGSSSDSADQIVGTRIGPYRVSAILGEGGMGEVLLADRVDEQFSHRVAIKMVRRGVTSRQVQNRLRLERQILATLDHPNIARLLDGGTSDRGVPYIVMEYIDGVPIDRYCDSHRLTIEERIRLFQVVCSAVQYAHQNLIVHRDLKPSNILINPEGVPKLLDFGIAKVLDERTFGHTLAVTGADYRLMTPDHASPEQVRGEPVTTTSDVYVLGVLLYELLTGHKPFTLSTQRLGEVEHAICEVPPLPLNILFKQRGSKADHADVVHEICAQRSTSAPRLRRHLSGDLNNIVLTSLRKEPERRYASVEQFSADLGRYLADLPVAARGESIAYRLGKFVKRNALAVSVSAAAVLALLAFTTVTALQAQRIERERFKAAQIASFMTDLFEQSDPNESRGRDTPVREILDAGAVRIDRELRSQPDVGASLLATIGKVYTSLGEYDEAVSTLQRSLAVRLQLYGEHNADVAQTRTRLGAALIEKRDLPQADAQLQSALQTNIQLLGEASLPSAATLHSLGRLRQIQERFADSRQYFDRSLKFLDQHPKKYFDELTSTLGDYANLLSYTGDAAGAEHLFSRVLQLDEEQYGPDHPETTTTMHNLAVSLEQQGKLAEARPYFTQALATHRQVFGQESPQYIAALSSYGRFLRRSGDLQQAESVLREASQLRSTKLGSNHYLVAYTNVSLALVLLDEGRAAEAEHELRAALKVYGATLPHAHMYVATALRGLGLALLDQGHAETAQSPLLEAIEIQSAMVGDANPQVAATRVVLGGVLLSRRDFRQAESLLVDSYPVVLKAYGESDTLTIRARKWIETLFQETNRPTGAATYFARVSEAQ